MVSYIVKYIGKEIVDMWFNKKKYYISCGINVFEVVVYVIENNWGDCVDVIKDVFMMFCVEFDIVDIWCFVVFDGLLYFVSVSKFVLFVI